MERKTLFILLSLAMPAALAAAPRTMRVDYYHTGSASEEHFSLDRVVLEPLEWPGNPARALDDTNLGKYFFEVADGASGRVLFSRGFASVYGEWETTGEAKKLARTFHESLRFPRPEAAVRVESEEEGREKRLPGGLVARRGPEGHVRGRQQAGLARAAPRDRETRRARPRRWTS